MYYYHGEYFGDSSGAAPDHKVLETDPRWGGALVAYLHSHVFFSPYDDNDSFSGIGSDSIFNIGDGPFVKKKGKPLYLAAPNGTLKKLAVNSGIFVVAIISTNLPVDNIPAVRE